MLESILVQSAFYVPRELLEQGRFERALLVLRVAAEIEPDDPRVLWGLARTHSRLGQVREALRFLERVVESGVVDAATLERDAHLEPLRGDPRFRELVSRAAR